MFQRRLPSAQVDVPIPQAVEEVVHIPVTQTQNRHGPSNGDGVPFRCAIRRFRQRVDTIEVDRFDQASLITAGRLTP